MINYNVTSWRVLRPRLTLAFRALQNKGYIARQSFSCCRTCAGASLARFVGNDDKRMERCRGIVFYTQQEAAWMRNAPLGTSRLAIYYGPLYIDGRPYGNAAEVIAADLVAALKEQGLGFEWDGSTKSTVIVTGVDQSVLDAMDTAKRLGGDESIILFVSASRRASK